MERYNIKLIEKKWQDHWSNNKSDTVNIDRNKKQIRIISQKPETRIFFINSKIEDWSINWNNNFYENDTFQAIHNLTGCLTFIDTQLINVKINISNSNCEDSAKSSNNGKFELV